MSDYLWQPNYRKRQNALFQKILNRRIIGYDINKKRIEELNSGCDRTNEVEIPNLNKFHSINFTNNVEELSLADVFIITVPTPINKSNIPDLTPLQNASLLVGKVLKLRNKDKKKIFSCCYL